MTNMRIMPAKDVKALVEFLTEIASNYSRDCGSTCTTCKRALKAESLLRLFKKAK